MGRVQMIVIGVVRALPAPSVATTVSTFAPADRLTLLLQFAVLLADDVPPVANWPLTVTLAMPLPPDPLSVAVPAKVIVAVPTCWPDMARDRQPGAVVSAAQRIVICD